MALANKFSLWFVDTKKNITKQFILLCVALIVYSFIGIIFMELTSLMFINAGIHEFGHSAAVVATGSNITSIHIESDFSYNLVNLSSIKGYTANQYDDSLVFIPYIVRIGGPLFALVISILIVKTPYLRWFAPIMGLDNLLQMAPIMQSTDGYGIYYRYGAIVVLVTFFAFLILYLYLIYQFSIFQIYEKPIKSSRKDITEMKISCLWDYDDKCEKNL